jgi:hypothetical protein
MMGNAMWHAIVITSDRPFFKLQRNGRRTGQAIFGRVPSPSHGFCIVAARITRPPDPWWHNAML